MAVSFKIIDRDTGWAALFKNIAELKDARLDVGVLDDDKGNAMPYENSALRVVEVAAINEFGTDDGHIPARPFVRPVFDAQREKAVSMLSPLLFDVLKGRKTLQGALGIVGEMLSQAMKMHIRSGAVTPANRPSTVAHKGSDVPLLDEGFLVDAIDFRVTSGKDE